MSPAALAQQYRNHQVSTASEAETVLMLYDGAIRFLTNAMNELDKGNIGEKARLVEKSVNIILYLQSCLDKEKGGEIAANLDRLYDFMAVELTEANLKNNANKIAQVINLLMPIREAWYEITKSNCSSMTHETYDRGIETAAGEQGVRVAVRI